MSLGRKKDTSTTTKVQINAPPAIQQVDFSLPTGDRYSTTANGKTQTFQSELNPFTQATVNESLSALLDLAYQMNQTGSERQTAINQRGQDFFDLQADGINQDADLQLSKTRSDLNSRFGGAYNASFGADMLAQVENNRLDRLADARKQAALTAEDLAANDEDSRLKRFALFQNYLTGLNNQAQGLQSNAASVLSDDRQRLTDVATQRATLLNRLQEQDQSLAASQASQRRQQAAQLASQLALLAF